MDFEEFGGILEKHRISGDPAIADPRFMVRIDDLPPEYRDNTLGLYYPNKFSDKPRLWVPETAQEPTVLHELGHRIADYYYDEGLSEPFAQAYAEAMRKKDAASRRGSMVATMPRPPAQLIKSRPARSSPARQAGQYTEITSVNAPSIVTPGDQATVTGTVRNTYSTPIHMYVVGLWDTNRFIDFQDAYLQPNEEMSFSGSFIMPGAATVVEIDVFFDGSDGNVDQDVGATSRSTVNAAGAYQIPSDYTLQNYILYPAAATYTDVAEICSFGFTVPLTVIPGVSWLVENMLSAYVSACLENGATPLELRVYTQPAQFGSTNYIIQAVAFSNVAGRAARLAAIAWPIIIAAIFLIVAVGVIWETKALTSYRYGATQTTTTTSEAQTKPLTPGQSFAVTSGNPVITNGSGPSTVTSSSGQKTPVAAGAVTTLGPGDTFVAGTGGASAQIPAQTVTTVGPSNPSGAGGGPVSDITTTILWVVGIGAFAALVLAGLYVFSKSKGYVSF